MKLFDGHFHIVEPGSPLIGFDQTYLRAALAQLGHGFIGITQVPCAVSDEEIVELHASGVRGVRFNLHRGGTVELTELERLAHRVHRLVRWHVEVYVDARRLAAMKDWLLGLPLAVRESFLEKRQ